MPLSLAAIDALLADNTAGDIAAADMRSAIAAIYDWIPPVEKYKMGRLPGETAHADDDFFSAYSGYTELAVTGTGVWTLGRAGLGVVFNGQSANDGTFALKSMTASGPPVTIETSMSSLVKSGANPGAGIVFSAGVIDSSASYWGGTLATNNFYGGGGTNAALGATSLGAAILNGDGKLYIRLIWKSSNTFARAYSLDGSHWTDFAAADTSVTLTPTHIGFVASAWSVAGPHAANFDYLRVYEADLSV